MCGHDGSHFAASKTPLINDVFAELMDFDQAITFWYHQHIIGHHCFTHVYNKDPDCHSFRGLRLHIEDPVRPVHRYQHIMFPFLLLIRYPLTHVKSLSSLMKENNGFCGLFPLIPLNTVDHMISLLRIVIIVIFMYGLPIMYHGYTWKGFIFACVPYALFSVQFGMCTVFNHQFTDIDELSSNNFYIHQVVSSQNIACTGWNYWVFLYTGGLTYQIEHHLFPTLNHTHLWRIQPIVQRLCKKYDIPYQIAPSFTDALYEMFYHMKKLAVVKHPSN